LVGIDDLGDPYQVIESPYEIMKQTEFNLVGQKVD